MSDKPGEYGLLLNQNIKLHRQYFKEMAKLIGICCIYKAPRPEFKTFDTHGDLDTAYYEPILVNCIFNDHPDQKTLKKQGWVSELQENSSMIHVPYDLPHLEVGALFIIPSGLDNAEGRVFRVIAMQNIMIYPASIACELAPEYESTAQRNEVEDFSKENFTVLVDNEEDD